MQSELFEGLITVIRTSGAYTYIGKASVGSATSDAVWQIKRFYKISTGNYDVKYAGGAPQLIKVFDDRATYTYS